MKARASELELLISAGLALPRQVVLPSGPTGYVDPAPRLELVASAADDVAHLYLYGSIGGWFGKSSEDVIAELRAIKSPKLRVHINSKGGDVFEGLAIYNTLREFPGQVETRVESLAASIASIIALAGEPVTMHAASMMMIHDPLAVAYGHADDMRKMARLLDKAAGVLTDVYVKKSGLPRTMIRDWMLEERWFTPVEARDAKLVTNVLDEPEREPVPDPGPAPNPEPTPEPDPEPQPAPAQSTTRRRLAARMVTAYSHLVS
jgi:ATP-dependent protease ClpP protease subunit